MAIIEVKVPQLSESVAEATLLSWKKKPGEVVAVDEILIEIETDKVVLEVPAPSAGVLAQLVKNDGDTVGSDEIIALIDTEGVEAIAATLAAKTEAIAAKAAARDETDGLSLVFDDWRLNLRRSNTEPLLRLNLEGTTPEIMEKRRDEILGIIRG